MKSKIVKRRRLKIHRNKKFYNKTKSNNLNHNNEFYFINIKIFIFCLFIIAVILVLITKPLTLRDINISNYFI